MKFYIKAIEVIGRFIIVFIIWTFFFWQTNNILLSKFNLFVYSLLLLLNLIWILNPIFKYNG